MQSSILELICKIREITPEVIFPVLPRDIPFTRWQALAALFHISALLKAGEILKLVFDDWEKSNGGVIPIALPTHVNTFYCH